MFFLHKTYVRYNVHINLLISWRKFINLVYAVVLILIFGSNFLGQMFGIIF